MPDTVKRFRSQRGAAVVVFFNMCDVSVCVCVCADGWLVMYILIAYYKSKVIIYA